MVPTPRLRAGSTRGPCHLSQVSQKPDRFPGWSTQQGEGFSGDQRVSRLEELQLQAEATDDFGVLNYGMGFGIAGLFDSFFDFRKFNRKDHSDESHLD